MSSGRGTRFSRRTNQSGGNTSRGRHSRARASLFHKSREFCNVITLVNVDGTKEAVRRRGQMTTTSHESVLQALSHQSRGIFVNAADNRSRSGPPDETGTLNISRSDKCSEHHENYILEQEIREINGLPVPEEVLQVHGYAPPKKADGTVRLIYENVNGLSNRLYGNKKVEQMKEIHDNMEVNIATYCEHKHNLCHCKNTHGFSQLFRGGEAAIQTIAAHNVHENVGQIQQGGTSLLLFGHLTEQLDFKESGKDPTGLGRWTVMTLQGEGVRTQIVCGYNPCGNNRLNSGTSYQQQRRFFVTEKGDLSCPRKKFHDDLTGLLNQWRNEGDRIVVCMDANENIYSKSIGKTLTRHEGLNMQEVVGEFTGKKIGPTFFGGKQTYRRYLGNERLGNYACVHYAHRVWRRGSSVIQYRLPGNKYGWLGAVQNSAVPIPSVKHQSFQRHY